MQAVVFWAVLCAFWFHIVKKPYFDLKYDIQKIIFSIKDEEFVDYDFKTAGNVAKKLTQNKLATDYHSCRWSTRFTYRMNLEQIRV
jgi:hypothetical protein